MFIQHTFRQYFPNVTSELFFKTALKCFNVEWVGPFVPVHTEQGIVAMVSVSFIVVNMLVCAIAHYILEKYALKQANYFYIGVKW